MNTYIQPFLDDANIYLQTFWETITFEFVLKFGVIYFFVIWIALIIWVIKDISIRTDSLLLQILSVFIILFLTPLGIFIYLIIRPSKTLYEKYYDEIEDNLDIFYEMVEERKKELEIRKRVEEKYRKIKQEEEKTKENESDEVLEIKNDQKVQEELDKKKKEIIATIQEDEKIKDELKKEIKDETGIEINEEIKKETP